MKINFRAYPKIVILIIVIILLATSLIGCSLFDTLKDLVTFDVFTDSLFEALLDGDGLGINVLIDDPYKYNFENKNIHVSLPVESSSVYTENRENTNNGIDNIITVLKSFKNLTRDEEITRDVTVKALSNAKTSTVYYLEEFIGANGPAADVPSNLGMFRFKTEEDIQIYLQYLVDLSNAFPKYSEFERNKCLSGYGRSDDFYERAVNAYRNIAPINIQNADHNFVTDFNDKIDTIDFLLFDSNKEAYKMQNLNAVSNLLDAYRIMADSTQALISDFPSNTRNQNGLAAFLSGADYYNEIFKKSSGTELSIGGAEAKLISYISDIILQIQQSMPVDLEDLLNQIYNAPGNAFTIENATTIYNRLKDDMSADFPYFNSNSTTTFKLLKQSEQKTFVAGYYIRTPIDNLNAQETIYINPNVQESSLYNLISHEGFPGHLYQNTYLKNKNVNKLRLLFSNTGWAEGWAEYCEEYAAEYFADDPLIQDAYRILVLDSKLSMALRCLADIKVNYYDYSLDELSAYMETTLALSFSNEEYQNFIDVAGTFPGLYLPYTFGDIMMKETKEKFFNHSPSAADLDFHKKLLEIGPIDFVSLQQYIYS